MIRPSLDRSGRVSRLTGFGMTEARSGGGEVGLGEAQIESGSFWGGYDQNGVRTYNLSDCQRLFSDLHRNNTGKTRYFPEIFWLYFLGGSIRGAGPRVGLQPGPQNKARRDVFGVGWRPEGTNGVRS